MKRVLKSVILPVRLIKNKVFLLLFLNGFLLALLVYFYVEDNYEDQIFSALAMQVRQTANSDDTDSLLKSSLHLTYNLEKYRLTVFGDKDIHTLKSDLIRPVTFDLMTGQGACGSYSYVLSRILHELNIESRFAQMKVNGVFGGHITVEAKSGNKWVALDPSYNMVFTKPGGGYASFNDVHSDWGYYKAQLPSGYDQNYNYAGVRYTNWEKVPVVMPAIKKTLELTRGKEAANQFSMRTLFLRKFNVLFKCTIVIYLLISFLFIRQYKLQSEEIEKFRLSLVFPKKGKSKSNITTPAIEMA